MSDEKTIEFVIADLGMTITLSESKPMILSSLTEQEVQALQLYFHLLIDVFSMTRALYSLQHHIEKKQNEQEKIEGDDNEDI